MCLNAHCHVRFMCAECEVIIRGPYCSLGLVPNSRNGSLGLVPERHFLYMGPDNKGPLSSPKHPKCISRTSPRHQFFGFWDWSQRAVLSIWDQILRMIIWTIIQSQSYKMAASTEKKYLSQHTAALSQKQIYKYSQLEGKLHREKGN